MVVGRCPRPRQRKCSLHLRPMASPPISRLRFVSPEGEPLAGPPEWAPCEIEIAADQEQLSSLRIWRGDERLNIALTITEGVPRIVADWPRSGAGSYLLRLEPPDGDEILPLRIRPKKLPQEAFEVLLDDLQRRLPATI